MNAKRSWLGWGLALGLALLSTRLFSQQADSPKAEPKGILEGETEQSILEEKIRR